MASDTTTAAWIFKRKYKDGAPGEAAMRFHPTVQMLSKVGDFVGHDSNGTYYYTVRGSNPQGVSGSFTNAQDHAASTTAGAAGGSSGKQFGAQDVTKYGVIRLAGRALRKARSNEGAFIDLVTMETNGIIDEVGDTLAFELFRDGTGARGRRSSINSNTVTLTNPDDARNFKIDMAVIASENADGSSPRTGHAIVSGIDIANGKITLDDQSDIDSFTNNDYLFRRGDPTTCVDGFESIIPLTAPVLGSDSFRGVDRATFAEVYAGCRLDNTGAPIEENAGTLAVTISTVAKGRASKLILNPVNFWQVSRRLGAKTTYSGGGGKVGYGYQSFYIDTPAGTLEAVSDPDCPTNRFWVMDPSQWQWKHVPGQWVYRIDDDKLGMFQRVYNSDDIEGRIASTGNVFCFLPSSQGVGSI